MWSLWTGNYRDGLSRRMAQKDGEEGWQVSSFPTDLDPHQKKKTISKKNIMHWPGVAKLSQSQTFFAHSHFLTYNPEPVEFC